MSNVSCPLCLHDGSVSFHEDEHRPYRRCPCCSLVFVPPAWHLSPAAERKVYDCHQNDPADPAYRRFLSRLFTPLNERLSPRSRGLDFGCGPGPALAAMFAEAGHEMRVYDPHYAPDPAALTGRYDFISSTEVFEHLRHPAATLRQLTALLRPGGWLGVMTKRVTDRQAFSRWHYRRDPTHIAFFATATFEWLAKHHGFTVDCVADDVVLLRRHNPSGEETPFDGSMATR